MTISNGRVGNRFKRRTPVLPNRATATMLPAPPLAPLKTLVFPSLLPLLTPRLLRQVSCDRALRGGVLTQHRHPENYCPLSHLSTEKYLVFVWVRATKTNLFKMVFPCEWPKVYFLGHVVSTCLALSGNKCSIIQHWHQQYSSSRIFHSIIKTWYYCKFWLS